MQQLRIAAIRTLHHLGLGKATVILAAPLAGARLRVLSLRVGHDFFARVIVFVVAKGVGWRRVQSYDSDKIRNPNLEILNHVQKSNDRHEPQATDANKSKRHCKPLNFDIRFCLGFRNSDFNEHGDAPRLGLVSRPHRLNGAAARPPSADR